MAANAAYFTLSALSIKAIKTPTNFKDSWLVINSPYRLFPSAARCGS
jgi:hypothetical protein